MDAYAVLLQACHRQDGVSKQKNTSNYFATALLNKRTRPITLQRRFQTKERVQLLCNGVSKQNNASNYFPTALHSNISRPMPFKRSSYSQLAVQCLSHSATRLPTPFN